MESKWINFIPNYKPSSKFVKPIFLRYIHIHSKTHDLFYASPFSNNNQRTNWHLRFPSTTQLRAVSSPFTPVAKCAPLPTSRRWSSIALKRRRYTNAGDTTVSEWSRGKRGIEKTNIETLPSTFHFQENGPMYRLNYIFPGPPPLLLPVCRQRTPCPSSRAHTYACTQSGIPLSREKRKSERDGQ